MSQQAGPVPCQCAFCAAAVPAGTPAPAATAEDLLCDQCRVPLHKMLSAALLRSQHEDGRAPGPEAT